MAGVAIQRGAGTTNVGPRDCDWFQFVVVSGKFPRHDPEFKERLQKVRPREEADHAEIGDLNPYIEYSVAVSQIGVHKHDGKQWELMYRQSADLTRLHITQVYVGDALDVEEQKLEYVAGRLEDTVKSLRKCGYRRARVISAKGSFGGKVRTLEVEELNPIRELFNEERVAKIVTLVGFIVAAFLFHSGALSSWKQTAFFSETKEALIITGVDVVLGFIGVLLFNLYKLLSCSTKFTVRSKL